jgi:hypothetical protein
MSSFVQPTYFNNSTSGYVSYYYFISGTEKCLQQDCSSLAPDDSYQRGSSGRSDQWGLWVPIVYSQDELNSNYVIVVQEDYVMYLWLQPSDDSVITLYQSTTLTYSGGSPVTTVPPNPIVEITLSNINIAGLSVQANSGGIIIIGVLDSTENPNAKG